MKILVINGPNLNFLGIREKNIYGDRDYAYLLKMIGEYAEKKGVQVSFFQSNHEGDIVDRIQQAYGDSEGIIINAAAYTHTSVAILDALKAVGIPAVEVHMTDINEREDFRRFSYVSLYAFKTIMGKGFNGYLEAVDILSAYDRVCRMEKAMERVKEALKTGVRYDGYEPDLDALKTYYSGEWKKDFEMDEEGCFPEDMKMGVLSEDGLYDLLEEAGV